MLNNTSRSVLVNYLKAKRRSMGASVRKRRAKPTRWLYPWATEKHYQTAIRAWFKPMREYVINYIKEHSEAILRGDSSTAVIRADATTGRTFSLMVRSLNAWVGQYISDDPHRKRESPIYTGLGNIAETTFDFNDKQYEKSAKANLGIEFPVNEDWWPDARETWQDRNYDLIQSDIKRYISQVNGLTERAVTSGWSLSELSKKVKALDVSITENRARFIARDQIGKLNGQITQRRMEAAGLSMYIWSTSGDERVRGDPAGFFPDADSSHYIMDNLLCRWDDPTVYSEDGGKTWIDRPSNAVLLHPGEDYQCRCTAMAYWNEIVDEADEQIDLLSEDDDTIPNSVMSGLAVMNPPTARTKNELLNQRAEEKEAKRIADNAKKARQAADREFPGEKWQQIEKGIYKSERRKLEDIVNQNELRDAQILHEFGSTVYLVPHNSRSKIPQYDAIVNGLKMELKNVKGKPGTLESDFLKSRSQAPNVFINLEKSNMTRSEAIEALVRARNSVKRIDKNGKERRGYAEYNRFKGGRIILKLKGHNKLIYLGVDDLKVLR